MKFWEPGATAVIDKVHCTCVVSSEIPKECWEEIKRLQLKYGIGNGTKLYAVGVGRGFGKWDEHDRVPRVWYGPGAILSYVEDNKTAYIPTKYLRPVENEFGPVSL